MFSNLILDVGAVHFRVCQLHFTHDVAVCDSNKRRLQKKLEETEEAVMQMNPTVW